MLKLRCSLIAIAQSLLASLILLFILESGARTYTWHKEGIAFLDRNPHPLLDMYDPHPELTFVPRPGAKWKQFSINSSGYRGREFVYKKSDNVFRIVAMGGSTTWGYIVDNEHTWTRELEKTLNESNLGDLTIEVINAGVPGYNSAESLVNLKLRIMDLSPDLIIIYHAYNDLKANGYPGVGCDYSQVRDDRGAVPVPFVERHLRLGYIFFNIDILNKLRRFLPQKKDEVERHENVSGECVKAFQDNLRDMVYIAREHSVDVLLNTYASYLTEENLKKKPEVFKPVLGFVPRLTYAGMMDGFSRYNQAVLELAKEERFPVVEQDKLIPKTDAYFYDHVHFKEEGTKLFASNIAKAILKDFPLSVKQLSIK